MASVDVDWAGAADAQVRKGLQLVMRVRMNNNTFRDPEFLHPDPRKIFENQFFS